MQSRGLKIQGFFLALALTLPLFAHAEDPENLVELTIVDPEEVKREERNGKPAKGEDDPSFIRKFTWSGSLDAAGDATRKLEGYEFVVSDCPNVGEAGYAEKIATPEGVAAWKLCQKAKRDSKNFSQEARKIRKEQRILSDVSKVSDAAAVGAIGAVGVSQLFMKDDSQAKSLEKVANIQETAGKVSYVSGATDMAIGAYVLASEKKRLEKMKKNVNGSGIANSSVNLKTDMEDAIQKTKTAAYRHMMYGAGKVAVGYGTMWLSKENRKNAKKLESLPTQMAAPVLNAPTGSSTVSAENNSPSFSVPAGSSTSDTGSGTESAAVASGGSSSGASVMPEFNSLAGKKLGGLSASSSPSAAATPAGGARDPAAAGEEAAELAAEEKKKDALDGFEVPIGGGGGSRYNGGSGAAKAEESPIMSALNGMFGGEDPSAQPAATGINPGRLYQDATAGEVQASNENGVNSSEFSLFQITKSRINRSLELGKLSGPGEVEVKN